MTSRNERSEERRVGEGRDIQKQRRWVSDWSSDVCSSDLGQISSGGPMPSITLKGVSIKGQSKVAYTEAVTRAQSEAQSALSQEQVPRAYQGAVKDYFDDLKE